MEEIKLYFIKNIGCDDETCGLVELTESELSLLVLLVKIFHNLNKNSQYTCMPRIHIAEVKYEMFRLLSPDDVETMNKEDIFYNQFGEPFAWNDGYNSWMKMNWIDYKEEK